MFLCIRMYGRTNNTAKLYLLGQILRPTRIIQMIATPLRESWNYIVILNHIYVLPSHFPHPRHYLLAFSLSASHTLVFSATDLASKSRCRRRTANPKFLRLGRAHIHCRSSLDRGINESIADPITITACAADFADASTVVCNMNYISTILFKCG